MFDELIIKALPGLVKFFESLQLDFYFTKPQNKYLQAFIIAMMLKGFNGKMNDIAELSLYTHRTGYGRFLDSAAWNEAHLLRALNEHVIKVIWQKARDTKQPVYIIIDDTICEKAKPSSKALSPIYGASFHKSHLKGKSVYGHQFVCCMLRCGDLVLPYNIVLYERTDSKDKKTKSKIDIAKEIIESLPSSPHGGYVVTDSWYSCQALFEAAKSKGYHFIGAIRSNRLIFPRGFRKKGIKIGIYARSLKQSDFDLVTVAGLRYHTYTYLGRINGQRKVKIIISWPKGSFGIPQTMKVFVSTDIEMNPRQVLTHYMKRWPIEVFFREANRCLGMKQCQVRSKKAIMRYQYILMLGYIFCGFELKDGSITLGKQLFAFRKTIEKFRITWIFEKAQSDMKLVDIYAVFKVSA